MHTSVTLKHNKNNTEVMLKNINGPMDFSSLRNPDEDNLLL